MVIIYLTQYVLRGTFFCDRPVLLVLILPENNNYFPSFLENTKEYDKEFSRPLETEACFMLEPICF